MRFDIITLFPKIFNSYFNESIIKRAIERQLIQVKIHNLRNFSRDKKHRKIDDRPYGGGAGMVLMAEPILEAVASSKRQAAKGKKLKAKSSKLKIIVFSAKGKQLNQKMIYDWAKKYKQMILISGRYEGIDERVKRILKAEEICIGPYIMTDGDVAAMAVISAVARLIPGVINWKSLEEESYFNAFMKKEENKSKEGNFEYPHYTRPEVLAWRGKKYRVPKVLLTGDHKKIVEWRSKHKNEKA